MNTIARGLLCAVLTLLFSFSFAQINELKLGDQLPDLVLNDVLNYKTSTLRLADFKGKNIIIDFWNQKCVPCVKDFPKIDSIQQRYKDDLQIILVNIESKDSTEKFFNLHKNFKMPAVPLVTGDRLLKEIFPHDGYPYHIWIDKRGTIQYFSPGNNTTVSNVNEFISGKQLKMFDPTFKKRYGSLKDEAAEQQRFEFYSGVSHCDRQFDIGGGQKPSEDGRMYSLAYTCTSILNLIRYAYGENGKYNFRSNYALDVKVKDFNRIEAWKDHSSYDQWADSNAYSYELWLPISRKDERFVLMQEDIKRYFNLNVWIEKRKVKSLVLSIADEKKLNTVKTKGAGGIDDLLKLKYGDSTLASYRLINYPFYKLVYYLQSWFIQYPFFKECDYKGNVDFVFKREVLVPLNFESLQKQLLTAGLYLRFEEREIPVLVVRDKY